MRWLDSIADSMDITLRRLWEIVKGREGKPGMLPSVVSQRVRHDLSTEKQLIVPGTVLGAWNASLNREGLLCSCSVTPLQPKWFCSH